MAAAAIPLAIGGTALQLAGQRQAMKARAQSGALKAKQLERQADKAIEVSKRAAAEERRKKDLIASRALALAAAGGGASDPTTVRILADIEGEGAYRESVALYEGKEEARTLREGAALTRYGVEQDQSAQRFRQLTTVLSGASSVAGAYKPKSSDYMASSLSGAQTGGAAGYG